MGLAIQTVDQQQESEVKSILIRYMNTLEELDRLHRGIDGILSVILCDTEQEQDMQAILETIRHMAMESNKLSNDFKNREFAKLRN